MNSTSISLRAAASAESCLSQSMSENLEMLRLAGRYYVKM